MKEPTMTLTIEKLKTIEDAANLKLQGGEGALSWEEIANLQLVLQMVAQLRLDRKRRSHDNEAVLNDYLNLRDIKFDSVYQELKFKVETIELDDSVTYSYARGNTRERVTYEYSPLDERWESESTDHLNVDGDFDFELEDFLVDLAGELVGRLRGYAISLVESDLNEATDYAIKYCNTLQEESA